MNNSEAAARFRRIADLIEKGDTVNFDINAAGDNSVVVIGITVKGIDLHDKSYPGGFAEMVRRIAR